MPPPPEQKMSHPSAKGRIWFPPQTLWIHWVARFEGDWTLFDVALECFGGSSHTFLPSHPFICVFELVSPLFPRTGGRLS